MVDFGGEIIAEYWLASPIVSEMRSFNGVRNTLLSFTL